MGKWLKKPLWDQLLGDDYVEMPAEEVARGGEKNLLDGLHAKLVGKLMEQVVDTRGGCSLSMAAPDMAKLYLSSSRCTRIAILGGLRAVSVYTRAAI